MGYLFNMLHTTCTSRISLQLQNNHLANWNIKEINEWRTYKFEISPRTCDLRVTCGIENPSYAPHRLPNRPPRCQTYTCTFRSFRKRPRTQDRNNVPWAVQRQHSLNSDICTPLHPPNPYSSNVTWHILALFAVLCSGKFDPA